MKSLVLVLSIFLAAAEPPAGEAPSRELLEFLGSFANFDGEWVDPLSLPESLDSIEIEAERSGNDEQPENTPGQNHDKQNENEDNKSNPEGADA